MTSGPGATGEPSPAAAGTGPGRGLAGMLGATASFRSSQNMAQTTLSLLGRSLGLTGTAIGTVAAGANLLSVVTMLAASGRVGVERSRLAVVVGLVTMAASLGAFALRDVAGLLAGAVLLGVAGGLVLPSLATAIADRPAGAGVGGPRSRRRELGPVRALAVFGLVLSASLTLGPLVESGVLAWSGEDLRVAYLAFVPVALIGALGVRPGAGGPEGGRAPTGGLGRALWALARNRRFGLAMCAQALYAVPFSVVVVFGGLVARERFGVSASATEAAIAIFFGTSFIARGLLAWSPVTERRVRVFAWCAVLTLAGLLLLGLSPGPATLYLALGLLGVPHGLTYPVALGLVAESVPKAGLAQANAGFAAVTALVNIVVPLALGAVIDASGSRVMLLGATLPVLLLAAVLGSLRDADRAPLALVER